MVTSAHPDANGTFRNRTVDQILTVVRGPGHRLSQHVPIVKFVLLRHNIVGVQRSFIGKSIRSHLAMNDCLLFHIQRLEL